MDAFKNRTALAKILGEQGFGGKGLCHQPDAPEPSDSQHRMLFGRGLHCRRGAAREYLLPGLDGHGDNLAACIGHQDRLGPHASGG